MSISGLLLKDSDLKNFAKFFSEIYEAFTDESWFCKANASKRIQVI